MGSSKADFSYVLIINSILIFICLYSCDAQELKTCRFDAIYQLGDSISDTGNSIIEIPQAFHARLPFGQTINKPTGRPSYGFLMIDYIAQSAGLPLLEPYENPNANFSHGVNFAVAGVTALPVKTLIKWDIPPPFTNHSLGVQLKWLKKYLSKKCTDTKDCQEKLKSSLFMVGTIGTNDYDFGFFQGKSIEEVKKIMVPKVIRSIINAVKKVIHYGAFRVVVPGSFQMGCTPSLLTWSSSNKSAVYDSLGCLKYYNDFFMYHNNHLQVALEKVQKKNPNVHIIYGDLYNALQWILDNLSELGFKSFKQSCCGIGGKYNFNPSFKTMCGAKGVHVCSNPKEHVFWDGGHFSHEANKYLSEWLIKHILPKLQCNA